MLAASCDQKENPTKKKNTNHNFWGLRKRRPGSPDSSPGQKPARYPIFFSYEWNGYVNVASCRRFRRPAQCWQLNWRALGKQYKKKESSIGSTTEYSPNFSLSSVWLRFFFFGRTAGPMNSKSKGWGRKRFRNGLTPWCPTNCFLCHFKPFKNKQRNRRKKNMKWTNGAISMYHGAKKNVFLESVSFVDDMEV